MRARATQAASVISLLLVLVAANVAPAHAAEAFSNDTSAAGFSIGSVAQPTLFSAAGNSACATSLVTLSAKGDVDGVLSSGATSLVDCDRYTVTVRNEGAQSTGIAQVGETETCSPGDWEGAPTFKYAWVRGPVTLNGPEEVGDTQSYTIAAKDKGYALSCRATATNAYGTVVVTSTPVRVAPLEKDRDNESVAYGIPRLKIAAGVVHAPIVRDPTGSSPAVGEALECVPATWEHEGETAGYEIHQEYRWLVNGVPTGKYTTASTSTIESGEEGKTIQCEASAELKPGFSEPGPSVTDVFADSANSVIVKPALALAGEPPQLAGLESEDPTLADVPSVSGDTVTLADTLPSGVTPMAVYGRANLNEIAVTGENPLGCDFAALSCSLPATLPPGGVAILSVYVTVDATDSETLAANQAQVLGGNTPSRLTSQEPQGKIVPTPVAAGEPPFAIEDFSFQAFGVDGLPDAQAGDHPNAVTVGFQLPVAAPLSEAPPVSAEVKDVRVDLPLGFVGDPLVTARCPSYDLVRNGLKELNSNCPPDSQIGTIGLNGPGEEELPIYNVAPQEGYPAEFATIFLGREVPMFASVIPAPAGQGGYDLQVSVPGIPRVEPITAATITFFGDPTQHAGSGEGQAFLTNPAACGTDPTARIEADTWQEPGNYRSMEASLYSEGETLTGCSLLQFSPTLEAKVEQSSVDTPTGYEVKLTVPQAPNSFPTLATPELKDTTVALPEGLTVSPSAANGLQSCTLKQLGMEASEGGLVPVEAINAAGHEDGQEHIVEGKCPPASQIGTLQIKTPLLEQPLSGHVYLAQPECDPCEVSDAEAGKTFGLYLEAQGSGAIVKLAGKVKAIPSTGQLTAVFENNPQLPFSELVLKLNNGARAPLVTPQSCGSYTTTSTLSSWSGASTQSLSPLAVSGCSDSGTPFSPSFSAGTTSTAAGASTNFTLTFSRKDDEQDLGSITVHTPPGLVGEIAKVTQCGEAEANAGTCPASSLIGTTTVAAGAGSEPYWLHGQVYLTGPYKGDPFGLSIVVPTTAGPFTLAGNTGKGKEVVRASIAVDSYTTALTITSEPLPQVVDGVQIRLQTINVEINKPGFMLNPTDCDQQSIVASIAAAGGATSSASSPFAVSNCASLAFKPGFSASTQGKTSKKEGASLTTKLVFPSEGGDANLHEVKVTLPKLLPSRLSTLNKACLAKTFEEDPANCPAESDVGTAIAHTPVLTSPLTGPAYFVSEGTQWPELILVLQGEGVTIDVVGDTHISKTGVTTSTFATIPDDPITSFELTLPEGPYSVLGAPAAGGSLCGHKLELEMPTRMVGQNGAVDEQTTKIAVTGCAPALYVKGKKVTGDTARLKVLVPAAGKIKASGKGLSSQTKKPGKEKIVSLAVKLTKAQSAKLSKGKKVKAKITLAFTPKTGKKLSKTVNVTFKPPKAKKSKGGGSTK